MQKQSTDYIKSHRTFKQRQPYTYKTEIMHTEIVLLEKFPYFFGIPRFLKA